MIVLISLVVVIVNDVSLEDADEDTDDPVDNEDGVAEEEPRDDVSIVEIDVKLDPLVDRVSLEAWLVEEIPVKLDSVETALDETALDETELPGTEVLPELED